MSEEQNEEQKQQQKDEAPPEEKPPAPRWRPAAEPTCCGSGCADCPF